MGFWRRFADPCRKYFKDLALTFAMSGPCANTLELMEKQACYTCGKSKTPLHCGICSEPLCKSCAQILEEDTFSFLKAIPKHLEHFVFCGPCFDSQVAPEVQKYEELMAKAKETLVFYKKENKETRLVKRFADPLHVENCPDHDEAILRLAFLAAQKNFNSIIDVEVSHVKEGTGSYQKYTYKAHGIPANVHADKLIKDRSNWSNPN